MIEFCASVFTASNWNAQANSKNKRDSHNSKIIFKALILDNKE